jgi:DNA-binding MarR family transcriptional regulator
MARTRKPTEAQQSGNGPEPHEATDFDVEEHVRRAVTTWPQIDPEVEGIVVRIEKAARYLHQAGRASLGRVGLTKEEFNVLIALHSGPRSHGSLCRELLVSTGAMTNRLDKLEHRGLITRSRDPHDRRGVLLELTASGREIIDQYVEIGSDRERQLLAGLSNTERRRLNSLLRELLASLQAEIVDPDMR